MSAAFKLRDSALTVIVPRAEDGGAAGIYRMTLSKQDLLMAELASLPASIPGPPARPDMPVVSFVVRDKGSVRQLAAARPTSDPLIDKILAEIGRCEISAKASPAIVFTLEIQPPSKPPRAGRRQTMVVRLSAKGERGAEVHIAPGLLQLQSSIQQLPAAPGTTPLPPEWEAMGEPATEATNWTLTPGSPLDVNLAVNMATSEPRWIRAVLNGNVSFRSSDGSEDVRMDVSSKAIPTGVRPAGPGRPRR